MTMFNDTKTLSVIMRDVVGLSNSAGSSFCVVFAFISVAMLPQAELPPVTNEGSQPPFVDYARRQPCQAPGKRPGAYFPCTATPRPSLHR